MDDETKISQRLSENIPKAEPSVPAVDGPPEGTGYVADLGDDLGIYKLYDFFNVQPQFRTSENEVKLQTIYRWAADKAQSTDYLAVIKVIIQQSNMMNKGFSSASPMDRIHDYVKLEQQIDRLKEAQGWV